MLGISVLPASSQRDRDRVETPEQRQASLRSDMESYGVSNDVDFGENGGGFPHSLRQ